MKRKLCAIVAFGLCALGTPASSHEVKLQNLQIVHPWVRGLEHEGATPPRDVSVAMTVFNRGAAGDRLVAVSSPLAASAEIRLRGQPADAIAVGPASSVALTPGGLDASIVLHGVTDDLAGYETFPVWLTFEKAGRVEVAVFVEDFNVKNPSCSGSLTPAEMHAHDPSHTHAQSH
jgi:periplasmic copper chaperone A